MRGTDCANPADQQAADQDQTTQYRHLGQSSSRH
jgi:hypothetical protein